MTLQMDIEKDFAKILRNRLLAKGYPARIDETDEETISRYLNVLNRTIEPRARTTKRSRAFVCPPEHQAGLDSLIRTSEAGGDLRPYQSTGLEKDEYDDGMLNAWNLHHFHLGTNPHPRFSDYVARTGPLLYAAVTNDALYCLGVYDHGGWSMQTLLHVLAEDFPELSEPNSLTNNDQCKVVGLPHNYTDDEVQSLRESGINSLTQAPDGRILGPMGGGVNLSKKKGQKSFKVAKANIDIRKVLKEFAAEINSKASEAGVPDGHAATLIEESGKLLVVDKNKSILFEIDTAIVKPL